MVMIRYLMMLTLILVGLQPIWGQSGASMSGKVIDENDNNAEVISANIILKKDGEMIKGTQSDFDGNYNFSNIPAGTYDLEVSYVGLPTLKLTGIQLNAGASKSFDIKFPKREEGGLDIDVIEVEAERPIVKQDDPSNSRTITAEEIEKLATRNISSIAAQKTGVVQKDEGEAVSSSGSRSTSNDVYVDGVRQFGDAAIPETEIEQVQVITSGIPAEFGDVTGAITNIVTKGPSNKFTGGAQLETSQFLDAFGANRADISFAGPILKTAIKDKDGNPIMDGDKPKTRTLLGYRFAATYATSLDERPSALGSFQLKDDVLNRIKGSPLVANQEGEGRVLAADYLTADDFITTKVRPNARESYGIVNAKLDYKPTSDLFVSAGVFSTTNLIPNTRLILFVLSCVCVKLLLVLQYKKPKKAILLLKKHPYSKT
jgi:hypothetical protein